MRAGGDREPRLARLRRQRGQLAAQVEQGAGRPRRGVSHAFRTFRLQRAERGRQPFQVRGQRRQHGLRAPMHQPLVQLAQRMQPRAGADELAVQARQAPAARADARILEGGVGADRVEADDIVDEVGEKRRSNSPRSSRPPSAAAAKATKRACRAFSERISARLELSGSTSAR